MTASYDTEIRGVRFGSAEEVDRVAGEAHAQPTLDELERLADLVGRFPDAARRLLERRPAPARARLIACDLSGLDLSEVSLAGWSIEASDLSRATIRDARRVELIHSDLTKANLVGADMRWAVARGSRIDRARVVGLQTTMDCFFWSGLKSESGPDAYLLLRWLSMMDNPVMREAASRLIPEEYRAVLDETFSREA